MTELDLDAIRARMGRVELWLGMEPNGAGRNEGLELVEDDLPILLAEVERLRADLKLARNCLAEHADCDEPECQLEIAKALGGRS